jgi:uncharacterized NAD(P)/FAD-binding protein YdhS
MAGRTIAVIGAGFSGTLLALHLLQRAAPSTRVVLIERHRQFGRGPAYAPGNSFHLLNVPAGRMSAFHNKPNDFLDWLASQTPPATAQSFVPRAQFGSYVRHLLNEQIKREPRERMTLVRGEVLALDRSSAPLRLSLDRNREVLADIAVLATGNFPPEPPGVADPRFYDSARYHADPWASEALDGLAPDDDVLLIGTGLTMVDVTISLLQQGHRGVIYALSRRGLLPRRHAAGGHGTGGHMPVLAPLPTNARSLFSHLRREARLAVADGGTWHSVIDAMRPFTQDIWQAMSLSDKAAFLRHLRPWWDVHRHRLPEAVADRIAAACQAGQLTVQAGRIQDFACQDAAVVVTWRARRSGQMQSTRVARVINCAGPNCDYERISHPLIRDLLQSGTIRPDALRLGLDVTSTCAVRGADGTISRRIYAVGPVTKAAFWEMTAVPDLRQQCEILAQHLAGLG